MGLTLLRTPFAAEDIAWRVAQSGTGNKGPWAKVLAYVTNRAIMDRLDEVCGPENWKNSFEEGPGGGVMCGLSIRIDGEWITKFDGAENTKIESVKGGLSDSMKRAAVQWGIGRYLYNLTEGWANFVQGKGRYSSKIDNKFCSWNPPELPSWALPANSVQLKPTIDHTQLKELGTICKGFSFEKEEVYRLAGAVVHRSVSSLKEIELVEFEAVKAAFIKEGQEREITLENMNSG